MVMDGWRALAIRILGRAMQDCGGKSLYMQQMVRPRTVRGCRMTREEVMADGEAWLRESEQCDLVLDALGYPWVAHDGDEYADIARDPDFDWLKFVYALSGLM